MRKILAFLLLLTLGLSILWLIDRPEEPTPAAEPPPTSTDVPGSEEQPLGLRLGGPFELTLYDEETRKALLVAVAEDSLTEAQGDVLLNVQMELFDLHTEGVVQARLRAARARVQRRAPGPGGEVELRPLFERLARLEEVQGEFLSGVPVAPLTFEAPSAIIDLRDPAARRLSAEGEFTARSAEFGATGRGLLCDLDSGLIEIRSGGVIDLLRAGETPARLSARGAGPLQLRREGAPDGPLVLEAWEGALLELFGSSPGQLSARHITARASGTSLGGTLGIERLEAEDEVEWRSGEAVFRSGRAAASFSPEGRLVRARLEGLPSAQLTLQLGPEVLPDVTELEDLSVMVRGQEALDLTWDQGFHFELSGPSSVETTDFRLRSASGLEGWLAESERSARFQASGGVVVESALATLETGVFEVSIGREGPGAIVLSGRASGGARLEGKLADGRAYTLATPEGLAIERTAGSWRVIEGQEVAITLAEPDGFRARADRVTDLVVAEPENFRFRAEGAILFDSERLGRFGGERLDVFSLRPLSLRLEGTSEHKAYHEGPGRRASALSVEMAGSASPEGEGDLSLQARGEVESVLELSGSEAAVAERLELRSDELSFERTTAPGALAGEQLRVSRLTAQGTVTADVGLGDGSVAVNAAQLSGEWRQRLVEGRASPLELGALLIAESAVHAEVFRGESELVLDCGRLEVELSGEEGTVGFRRLTASQDVRFQGRREFPFGGEGEVLVFDSQTGQGNLQAPLFGRVTLYGRLPSRAVPFRLSGERVDFSTQGERYVRAVRPEIRMAGHRARAETLSADERQVELSGNVRVVGATPRSLVPWTLDAGTVVLTGHAPADSTAGELDALRAAGGVDFRLGERLRARGEKLSGKRVNGVLRLEGSPATFEGPFARLEADWVEFDPLLQMLVATGPGRMRSLRSVPLPTVPSSGDGQQAQESADEQAEWTMDFLSSSTLVELDSLVFVLQEPVFHTPRFDSTLRSSWAIFWLDRQAIQDLEVESDLLAGLKKAFEELQDATAGTRLPRLLEVFRSNELAGLQREVYFEGPVEVLSQGELLARADAIYLDTVTQHGWMARATVNLLGRYLGRDYERLAIKTDWLRLSSDGSLRADSATVTSCTYDDPHVRVVTGDLHIQTLESGRKEHFRLLLKDNRIELYDWLRIPLPTIDVNTDEEFNLLWPTLSVADSARFGTLLGLSIERPADKVGAVVNKATGHKDDDVDAHYKIDGSYLGSRGGLLDLGLEIESKGNYWLDLYLGLAYDSGEDRGFIRVDEDDRDTLRRWLRAQSYFANGLSAYTLSYSDQSDAGVQSEFFESSFLRYERAESYVQWRRSSEENFLQASVKVRTDSFRTDIEELPSLSGYRGRTPLLQLGRFSLVHTADFLTDYLRRREGSDPRSPFALPTHFPDGLGDREVARADTTQALEVPVPLGWAGLKLTPFVSARATAWNEGADESDSPTRVLAEAGARLGTTFWRRTSTGALHQVAPYVEVRSELDRSDNGGLPVEYDSVERVISGDFLRLGTRARWGAIDGRPRFDVDLATTHASDRSDEAPDGWLPLEIFSRLDVQPFGRDLEFWYDARLDLENEETVYSLFSVGTHFGQSWGVQAGHQFARAEDASGEFPLPLDPSRPVLLEAATISAIYRWTEKWEFEGRESFSLLEDLELDTDLVLRRYGHDIVLDIESSVREGEGSSFGISIRPRFGYTPSRVGYVGW